MRNLRSALGLVASVGALVYLLSTNTNTEIRNNAPFREFQGRASDCTEGSGRWVELCDEETKGILAAEAYKDGDWGITKLTTYGKGNFRSLMPYANQDSLDVAHKTIMGKQ